MLMHRCTSSAATEQIQHIQLNVRYDSKQTCYYFAQQRLNDWLLKSAFIITHNSLSGDPNHPDYEFNEDTDTSVQNEQLDQVELITWTIKHVNKIPLTLSSLPLKKCAMPLASKILPNSRGLLVLNVVPIRRQLVWKHLYFYNCTSEEFIMNSKDLFHRSMKVRLMIRRLNLAKLSR
jgi:hypothetical protein